MSPEKLKMHMDSSDTTQKLSSEIVPDALGWQEYAHVCKNLSLTPPSPEYPFSLYTEYCRIKQFSLDDHKWLAKCRASTEYVTKCIRCFPVLSGKDVHEMTMKQIPIATVEIIARCAQAYLWSVQSSIRGREIALIGSTSAMRIREYFEWYGADSVVREQIPFLTLAEVCGANVPLSFTQSFISKISDKALFGANIRELYTCGGDAVQRWEKYASWNVWGWFFDDILALIRSRLTEVEEFRVMDYVGFLNARRESGRTLCAADCVELARSEPSPQIETVFYYLKQLPDAPMRDIIACAVSEIPPHLIKEYQKRQNDIPSRHRPDEWCVEVICGLYRAKISPDRAVTIWDKFPRTDEYFNTTTSRQVRGDIMCIPGFFGLVEYLERSPRIITLGKRQTLLGNTDQNLSFFRGILANLEQSGKPVPKNDSEWNTAISDWEKGVAQFLKEWAEQEFAQIFTMTAVGDEDDNGAFGSAPHFLEGLRVRYGRNIVRDYSLGSALASRNLDRPRRFIEEIKSYLSKNPGKPVLIHLGFHGSLSGGTGPFSQTDLSELIRLSRDPRVVLDIGSCYGLNKIAAGNHDLGNTRLSSGRHTSVDAYESYTNGLFRWSRIIPRERLEAIRSFYPEDMETISYMRHRGDHIFNCGDSTMPPFVKYSREDIPEIMRLSTPSGRRFKNPDLLYALIEGIPKTYAADFDGDGKVSFSELAIYRAMNNPFSTTPTYFVGKNGRKAVIQ